jgi:hypothetical protein
MTGGEGLLVPGAIVQAVSWKIDGNTLALPAEAIWTAAVMSDGNGFTQIELNELSGQMDVSADASLLGDLTSQPPDDAPTGTRVPEPATLVFVGTGLIAISRASRMKQPRWNFQRRNAITGPISCPVPR